MIDSSSSSNDLPGPAIDLDYLFKTRQAKLDLVMNLKNQLKFYLDRFDISAAQLSKKSGISKQVLSLWLSGGSPRNIEQVKRVAETLGTTVDHLCFGSGAQGEAKTLDQSITDEWMTGVFEIKIRKVNLKK